MLQPAKGDLEDCVTTALTLTHMCVHVNMDLPEHGPPICPTAENLQTGKAWERVQVRECPPPGPLPPGKDSGNTTRATGPQPQGPA